MITVEYIRLTPTKWLRLEEDRHAKKIYSRKVLTNEEYENERQERRRQEAVLNEREILGGTR